jgi:leader peptidase (prepilin peptidase)/N-methyltransferase
VLPPALALAAVAAVGLCIGSFLNVVITRLPEGKNLVFPRSACPRCGHLIAWFDNVPVLSWLLLRGRCRSCRQRISWRYPAGELLTAAVFVAAFLRFGVGAELFVALLFLCALIAITGTDLDHQLIPDTITLPGVVAGFVLNLATARLDWTESLLGIVVGGGVFFAIILISPSGMGGGDMKLGAMMGAFLGWKLGLLAVLLGVLSGGLVAVCLLAAGRKGRKDAVPFGPFLALGGAVSMLWGRSILAWYLGRFGL